MGFLLGEVNSRFVGVSEQFGGGSVHRALRRSGPWVVRASPQGRSGARSRAHRRAEQRAEAYEIIRRVRKRVGPRDLLAPPMMQFAQAADRLLPPFRPSTSKPRTSSLPIGSAHELRGIDRNDSMVATAEPDDPRVVAHVYGEEGVRFYTRQKSVMQRWPESVAQGAEFVMPMAKESVLAERLISMLATTPRSSRCGPAHDDECRGATTRRAGAHPDGHVGGRGPCVRRGAGLMSTTPMFSRRGKVTTPGELRGSMGHRHVRALIALVLVATSGCVLRQRRTDNDEAPAICTAMARQHKPFTVASIAKLPGRYEIWARDTANLWKIDQRDTVAFHEVEGDLVQPVSEWERKERRSTAVDSLPRMVSPESGFRIGDTRGYFEWRLYTEGLLVRGATSSGHSSLTSFVIQWTSDRGFGGYWTGRFAQLVEANPRGGIANPYAGTFCAVRQRE